MNRLRARPRAGQGQNYEFSYEVRQFFARLSTEPSAGRKTKYATLIETLKSEGIWSKLDVLHCYHAENSTTARVNLVKAGHTAAQLNGPIFTVDQGFLGSATAYLRSQFTPSTQGVNFQQDSAHIGVWNLIDRAVNAGVIVGAGFDFIGGNNPDRTIDIYPFYPGNRSYARLNNAGDGGVTGLQSHGNFLANRSNATDRQLYRDGVSLGSYPSSASSPLVNLNLYILANNVAGVASDFSSDEVAFFSCGGSLTALQVAAFHAALVAYKTP